MVHGHHHRGHDHGGGGGGGGGAPQQQCHDHHGNREPSAKTNYHKDEPFSMEAMTQAFRDCLRNDTVHISTYNRGFVEMNKMLSKLGIVFKFVVAEIKMRIDNLDKMRHSERPEASEYKWVKSMVEYETRTFDLEERKSWTASGTRNLLNLHRALKFFMAFMEKARPLGPDEGMSGPCVEAYEATLAQYHNWAMKGAAKLAMKMLPTKDGLAKEIYGSSDPNRVQKINADGEQAVKAMKAVYSTTKDNFKITHRCDSGRSMGP